MRSSLSIVAGSVLAAGIVFAAAPAFAQSHSRIGKSNWRQRDRGASHEGSPQRFALELRFGPYYPAVDDEFGGSGPYTKVFGDAPRFHFGLEFDWQALRIPYVGTIGPGVGWGYTWATGKAFLAGTSERAGQDTSLDIMPMHASAVLRLDELYRRTGFPFVPYGKAGLGVGLWWTSIGGTGSKTTDGGTEVLGRGISYGVHWALGGMLALDWLSRRSTSALDQETGINHVYVFGEWMNQNLGLGGGQMHVGTSTVMVGLTFEM